MNCKICDNQTKFLFKKKVLNKYDSEYFQCENCGFIQVKNPHWLKKSYESAISSLDTGLVSRNLYFQQKTEEIILENFDYHKKFIDYGGGYGLFVRLMRDAGFNFYRQDLYCKNLFAQHFDINDLERNNKQFELLTAFELFEHFENPITEIEKMLKFSNSILFSTELQPKNINNYKDWWYFSPESGQHISFYTKKSLEEISKRFNLNLYTNNKTFHLLIKKTLKSNPFKNRNENLIYKIRKKISNLISPENNIKKSIKFNSFTQRDHDYIKKMLKNEQDKK